jgi:malonate-semialdehyde dehydrogenase (acetylating)/methylmalonate-semialdehyde dehydrogenase
MVVMPDAVIEPTVAGILGSAFGAAGQRCMAGSVVVTVGDAHHQLIGPLVQATRGLRVGDPMAPESEVGPLISPAAGERITGYVERAATAGATVAVDGREEVFGPVLSIIRVSALDEAIELVNASAFGNGTLIFTESGAAVRRYRHDV